MIKHEVKLSYCKCIDLFTGPFMFLFLILPHHSLQYIYTASSGIKSFPEFVAVGLVDGNEVMYYDSNTMEAIPKQAWMIKVTEDDPHYWEFQTQGLFGTQKSFINSIEVAKKRFNQTGGVHIFQNLYGCEFDDEYKEVQGWESFGYDGEDFIAFDLKAERWSAPVHQAFITKNRWDNDKMKVTETKYYITQTCPDWLKKYLEYGKHSLVRTDVSSVSFLQKSPSSPVSCFATGFYPSRAEMFWRKGEEEIHAGVNEGEILPNNDRTFQISVDLDLSSVPPEDWTKYECVFHLSGFKCDVVNRLEKSKIRINPNVLEVPIIAITVSTAVTILVLMVAVGFLCRKREKSINFACYYLF
uniref:H-2 class I histocompatibility antigen, Q9 alpha chain-like n=1 Tax=Poecilia latipinna TaxID=48699 RepID=A0A3B3V5V0_9TELE